MNHSTSTCPLLPNKGRLRVVLAVKNHNGRPVNRARRFEDQAMINIRISIYERETRLVNRLRRVPTKYAHRQMSNLYEITSRACVTIRDDLTVQPTSPGPWIRRAVLRQEGVLVLVGNRPTSKKAGLHHHFKGVVRSITCRRRSIIGVSFSLQYFLLLVHVVSDNRSDNVRPYKQLAVNLCTSAHMVVSKCREGFNPVSFDRCVTRNRYVGVSCDNDADSNAECNIALVFSRVQR